eukprot:CAMPEP_0170612318 /NCGR_PEP_ID=MMETSP0224-20130122/23660_1 /TAXON_ID=285029 /ORGANISM="Togula jolla, Strain CCCM 725" /LENGTH=370 /DNA_ID=CAMNT_0010937815 /DNA_START=46 /DNA_END=1158 /DNA_ORIENTATION=-
MGQDIEDPKFEILKIGPCAYRKLIVPDALKFKCDGNNYRYEDEEEDEEERELDDQMTYEGDEWVLRLPIVAVFHRFIVGSRARTKQRIELESGARITVPHRENQEDAIYLRARQKNHIYSAKAQIELLCEKEEPKLEYTHFLSVPLAHDARFRQQVDKFREDVILQRFEGIDSSIFMPSRRMHITLCMLKLHSHAQVEEMKQALEEAKARIAATAEFARPLVASLKGLHIMTDDPTSVSVVFTTDRASALQHRMNNLADLMFNILKARGLVTAQNLMAQRLLSSDGAHAEVKLHATLMNTKYSRAYPREDGSRGDRAMIDASTLMETFAGVDFGAVRLGEIQLSCLEEMGEDGYYRSLYSLPLCDQQSFG